MVGRRFGDYEHLLRVLGLFAAGAALFVAARALLVPSDFGVHGHFRAGSLDENRARPVSFASRATCTGCHVDVADAGREDKHAAVGCESCHGPSARHADADDPTALKPARPDAAVCLVCHLANAAKPRAFPQIRLGDHADAGSCLTCHQPHRPGQPPDDTPATASGAKP